MGSRTLDAPRGAATETSPNEASPSEPSTSAGKICLVCAGTSEDRICESCRALIQGEALEHKLEDERRGRF